MTPAEQAAPIRRFIDSMGNDVSRATARETLAALVARCETAERERDDAHDHAEAAGRLMEASEQRADRLAAALRDLTDAVEPLMESKPTEVLADGRLRYDLTGVLYAIQGAMSRARAALAEEPT